MLCKRYDILYTYIYTLAYCYIQATILVGCTSKNSWTGTLNTTFAKYGVNGWVRQDTQAIL